MANRRELVKRRKAVRNIRKITRTMELIATSRFQKAYSDAIAGRPYSDKLGELVADLARAAGELRHPLMETNDADRESLLVITSNRGLCGAYNANVLRSAVGWLDDQENPVDVHMVGKKGLSYFRFLGREVAESTTSIDDRPRFPQIEPVAQAQIDRFLAGEISSVSVVYMRFISTGVQRPEVIRLLPLTPDLVGADSDTTGPAIEYEISPSPEALLDDLLPASVRQRLFQCFLDAAVSEQVARMVAMKAATDAAGDMIKDISRQYNRARQTHITMELLDIVGGAAALE
ncbi:MAG: ATP synthase F1 subunit gamma [Acidobacteriota bacterium]